MSTHLTDMEIAAWLDNSFQDQEKHRAEEHLEGCRECREKVRSIKEVMEHSRDMEVPEIPEEIKRQAIRFGETESGKERNDRSFYRVAGVAASVLLVASIFLWGPFSDGEPQNTLRSTDGIYDIELSYPGENAVIISGESFEWKELNHAVLYRFTIYDEEGTLIFQDEMRSTNLSTDSVLGLELEKAYFWQVEAIGGDGTIRQSPLSGFVLIPKPAD